MTIKHLRIFVTVFQTENITHAAKQLYMTQPSVSRAIQELENHYGVKLFERINHRLFVTESGKQLYAQAHHIVDLFDAAEKRLRNWDEFGILRVGATITIGNILMPKIAAIFQKSHPHLRLEVNISSGAQLQQAIFDDHLDIALVESSMPNENLTAKLFSKDRLVLILSPNDPLLEKKNLYLQDLANCKFLLRDSGSVGRSFLNHIFAAKGIPLVPLWESVSTSAIINGVSEGLGISILPQQLVAHDIQLGKIVTVPIIDESFRRNNYIIWHKNKYLTKSAKEFISLCENKEQLKRNDSND